MVQRLLTSTTKDYQAREQYQEIKTVPKKDKIIWKNLLVLQLLPSEEFSLPDKSLFHNHKWVANSDCTGRRSIHPEIRLW
jgi:hypothetical protein